MKVETKSPKPAAPAAAAEPSSRRGKRFLVIGAAAIVGLGAAWGVGRLQGASGANEAEKRAQEATGALEAERARVERLEARRRLHLSLIALDERNFGIAEKHLAEAAALLKKRAGDDAAIGKLASELSEARLPATQDLAPSRAKLLDWARRLDETFPAKLTSTE